jgi:hypothetical protein
MTQASQYVQNNMDSSLFNKKVEEFVQYVLFCPLAEQKGIVRRTDINKNVLKEHSKAFVAIMQTAAKKLDRIFGIQLIDLDGKVEKFAIKNKFFWDDSLNKFSFANTASQRPESFNMSSTFSASSHDGDEELRMHFKYSVIMVALALIFMNKNEIDANKFWDLMKKIDINRSEKRHKYLGDVEKYFTTELVKEGYLEYEQEKGFETPTFKFKWGYRAKMETSKKKVLEFVCEMYGGEDSCKPQDWQENYKDAMKDENGDENEENNESMVVN